jgi:hypothetical protein
MKFSTRYRIFWAYLIHVFHNLQKPWFVLTNSTAIVESQSGSLAGRPREPLGSAAFSDSLLA